MTTPDTKAVLRRIGKRHCLQKTEIHTRGSHLWLSGYAYGHRVAVRANAKGSFYITLSAIQGRPPAILEILPRLRIGIGRKNTYHAVSRIPSESDLDAILTLYRSEARFAQQ